MLRAWDQIAYAESLYGSGLQASVLCRRLEAERRLHAAAATAAAAAAAAAASAAAVGAGGDAAGAATALTGATNAISQGCAADIAIASDDVTWAGRVLGPGYPGTIKEAVAKEVSERPPSISFLGNGVYWSYIETLVHF